MEKTGSVSDMLERQMSKQPASGKGVVVTDIDISFNQMVWLMVKLAFATIPAAIVIAIIYGAAYFLLIGVLKPSH